MTDLAVWFDLDGTLLEFGDYGSVLERACTETGIDPTESFLGAYDEHFFAAFGDHHPDPYRRGAAAAIETAGSDAAPDAFVDAVRTAEFEAATTPEAVRDALAGLAAADGVSVGVLTNGVRAWQVGKLEHNGLVEHVDATLTSYEVGAHKPDSEVFARAEELLPAGESVMVGDDFDADVVGARERGWRAVRVDGPVSVAATVAELR